jgi:hypothetical protein
MLAVPVATTRAGKARARLTRTVPVPAPVEGWDASSALASMKPLRAVELLNWFPQPGWLEVRKGFRYHSWGMGAATPVESLMVWQGPGGSKLFAAAGDTIYDVTSNAVASSAVTSLSNARFQHTMMRTSAGAFLWVCNGEDAARHYNGTTWASPSLTGVAADDIVSVCLHKKRLWFVINDSTSAYYLATDAVAGAATEFPLGANFSRGGYLLAMATWTRDGGSGADDYAVFISSRGQVAVYQGTDPSSASTWGLVGVFDVPTPIGRRCFTRYGGDLLLLTLEGLFPLSQLLSVDQSQAERVAITERISSAFNDAAASYGSLWGWEACVFAAGTRLFVNIPTSENATAKQYVMNTLTGAWCEYDNHHANCWAVYNDQIYFGGMDGRVYRANTGRADVATAITAVGQTAYQAHGTANVKRFSLLKPLVTATGTNRPALGISLDFSETETLSSPPASQSGTQARWDSATWDVSTWESTVAEVNDWANVVGIGAFGSIKFRAQTGVQVGGSAWGVSAWGSGAWGSDGTSDETMRINGFLVTYEPGGVI